MRDSRVSVSVSAGLGVELSQKRFQFSLCLYTVGCGRGTEVRGWGARTEEWGTAKQRQQQTATARRVLSGSCDLCSKFFSTGRVAQWAAISLVTTVQSRRGFSVFVFLSPIQIHVHSKYVLRRYGDEANFHPRAPSSKFQVPTALCSEFRTIGPSDHRRILLRLARSLAFISRLSENRRDSILTSVLGDNSCASCPSDSPRELVKRNSALPVTRFREYAGDYYARENAAEKAPRVAQSLEGLSLAWNGRVKGPWRLLDSCCWRLLLCFRSQTFILDCSRFIVVPGNCARYATDVENAARNRRIGNDRVRKLERNIYSNACWRLNGGGDKFRAATLRTVETRRFFAKAIRTLHAPARRLIWLFAYFMDRNCAELTAPLSESRLIIAHLLKIFNIRWKISFRPPSVGCILRLRL